MSAGWRWSMGSTRACGAGSEHGLAAVRRVKLSLVRGRSRARRGAYVRTEVAVIATAQGGLGALCGAIEHVAGFGRAAGFALFAAVGRVLTHDFVLPSGGHQSGLMVLAAITLTGMLVALLAPGARSAARAAAVPPGFRPAALRAKSWRAGFLPQRDPDAPGRSRPRAPTASPAAA